MQTKAQATVPAKVTLGAVKIHGPNSTLPEGTREDISTEGPQIKQVTYAEALHMWGKERADELFRGVPEEDR
jgi:hypothetical protein